MVHSKIEKTKHQQRKLNFSNGSVMCKVITESAVKSTVDRKSYKPKISKWRQISLLSMNNAAHTYNGTCTKEYSQKTLRSKTKGENPSNDYFWTTLGFQWTKDLYYSQFQVSFMYPRSYICKLKVLTRNLNRENGDLTSRFHLTSNLEWRVKFCSGFTRTLMPVDLKWKIHFQSFLAKVALQPSKTSKVSLQLNL